MGPGAVTGGSFDILLDSVACPPSQSYTASASQDAKTDDRGILDELPLHQGQNQRVTDKGSTVFVQADVASKAQHLSSASPENKSLLKSKVPWRLQRHRRQPIDCETFEPLDAVIEETSFAAEAAVRLPSESPRATDAGDSSQQLAAVQGDASPETHVLNSVDAHIDVEDQIVKHLAATPLEGASLGQSGMDHYREQINLTSCPPPPYSHVPLKVPELVTVVERSVSPSLSAISDRSGSFAADSVRTGSFSLPRIEDSLEELDKLEDELEAVNAAALAREIVAVDDNTATILLETPRGEVQRPSKRASIAGQSLTVRVTPSDMAKPPLRRTSSMTLRDRNPSRSEEMTQAKAVGGPSRDKPLVPRNTPKTAAKSQKPLTVPKFELPGDAVAKRLKEQREARQAQQAEALAKLQSGNSKPRVNRPLTKPTFELPGEAISRRKREEREAKLRAEEEEERKKREFKARPVRHSIGPATLPRDTVASRARQTRISQGESDARQSTSDGAARKSIGSFRGSTGKLLAVNVRSLPSRGRHSMVLLPHETSRDKSTSSRASKRSSLSAEELEHQRRRGKEIFARDSVFSKDKERDRRERESNARMAREQAAERSRMASREWAEKKRRKELATKEAQKQTKQGEAIEV